MKKYNKISVIGAGFVGSATTFALMQSGIASSIVMVDVNNEKAQGEIMDLAHGAAFIKSVDLIAGSYKDTHDSDIVIITAGVGQKQGETRLDLIKNNVEVFKSMIPQIVRYSPNSILLVVSNPVDILTYITYKLSGFPSKRVIGSGTVLDSSRLKYEISKEFDLDARDVHAYIIGEHGDSEFAIWSSAFIGATSLHDFCEINKINEEDLKLKLTKKVRDAAYEIISKKGYTNYAIALAVNRIVEAILRDEKSIMTISTYDSIEDVYYSSPNIVGKDGQVLRILPKLSPLEMQELENSKKILKDVISNIDLR